VRVETFRSTRRRLLALMGSAATFGFADAMAQTATPIATRLAATAGEKLPLVGVGTYQTFDVGKGAAERGELTEVLRTLVQHGGSVVDSSPMYGRAEGVAGDLAAETKLRSELFLATKVWTRGEAAGIAQMEDSLRLLRTPTIDLMQVHNLVDWRTHLKTLKQWKASGRLRHLGITHYHADAYDELMSVMRTREFAFVQFNFSMAEREAEQRLLPLCAELGMGVLINRPFSQGDLFPRVKGKPLPEWAREFDCTSWAQFFLKWILGHPAVTCVIPGTRRVAHLEDNLAAGRGRVPDAAQRARMLELLRRI
jgi:aryl-alcohol dehydrogenase-like predicted oxidoreductase